MRTYWATTRHRRGADGRPGEGHGGGADGRFTCTPDPASTGTDTLSDGTASRTGTVTVTGRPGVPAFQAVLSEGHVDVGIA